VTKDAAAPLARSRPPEMSAGVDLPRTPRQGWPFAEELQWLQRSPAFWAGLLVKVLCAFALGSHFATRWFAPVVYEAAHGRTLDVWSRFFARGEPLAFPYGPGMLLALLPAFIPAAFSSFDPSGHLALLLLRVPLLAADLAVLLVLMRWSRVHAPECVNWYWLSPIVVYATYVHGQLDLIPMALLVGALYLAFTRSLVASAVVFGLALATKLHILVALPFVVVFLYRDRRPRLGWLYYTAGAVLVAAALLVPAARSFAFRTMVFGSAETKRMWAVTIPYGAFGVMLHIAPAALGVTFLRFATYRKLNRELTLVFVGIAYLVLVALVPPQPGWFLWSLPLLAFLAVRFGRNSRTALLAVNVAYLGYFLVAEPRVTLEALDPTLGRGFGDHAAQLLAGWAPAVFSPAGASVLWSGLFACLVVAGSEMYRRGVVSNAVYPFRDQSFMLGIGGDSAAGKHTIAVDLGALLGDQFAVVYGDDDHKWERGHVMWRRYTHLDPRANRLGEQLTSVAALRTGADVRRRHYDHGDGRFTEPQLTATAEFVAIVGLHPFYLPTQRELLHLKVFVDPAPEIRRSWKIARDVSERGHTPERVEQSMAERSDDSARYVQPQMRYADVVVRYLEAFQEAGMVSLELEMGSTLEPLQLIDALERVDTLEVTWTPDESLSRDRLQIRGFVDERTIRRVAAFIIPNLDDLVTDAAVAFHPGARGLVQLALLHAISARLRLAALGVQG